MASEYAARLDAAVRAVAPILRKRGFKKQRHAFNAEAEPGMTQALTFQMGAHKPPGTVELPDLRPNLYGSFTVNLGLYFEEVRTVPPVRPRPKFVREGDTHVSVRIGQLLPERGDVWWTLDATDDELRGLVEGLVRDDALPFFAEFSSRDALLRAWHARDPRVRYTPEYTIGVIHAVRGEKDAAAALFAEEVRTTERPARRDAIVAAAAHLGLDVRAD